MSYPKEPTYEELYKFLVGINKPHFVDTFRKLLNQFDKEEISMSKFVEELNIQAYKWHLSNSDKNDERTASQQTLNQGTEPLVQNKSDKEEPLPAVESDAVAFAEWIDDNFYYEPLLEAYICHNFEEQPTDHQQLYRLFKSKQ